MDAAETARQLRKEGNGLLQLNMPQEALERFERALVYDPADAFLLNDRGNALQSLQRFPEALASYDGALRSKREFAAALTNRGNALRALRRFDEALADLDAAVRIKPDFAEALNNRGNVLRDLQRLPEALDDFTAALALKPHFALAECNRGHTLLDLRRPGEALACFERLLHSLPDAGEALFGRASALFQLRQRLEQALVDFERAAQCGIERTETLVGKASVLAELQRHGEAAACLAEVLSITPDRDYARGSLLYSKLQACDWSGLAAATSELTSLLRRQQRVTHPLSLLPLEDSPDLQLKCARLLIEDQHPQSHVLGPCLPRAADKSGRRLRVAYLSADFREHPVSRLLVGVLESHDRQRFEVLGISLAAEEGGAFEQRVRRAFDRFIDVSARSDREVAQLLREQEVDIVVDLMGFTQGMRPGIFAFRAAPVQVNYLGYAGTSGAPYMDYLLADGVVIPRGCETGYSEQVVRMPHCYLPYDSGREIGLLPGRAEAGLPERGIVFCAFTSPYKINPEIFGLWMRVLRAVPESVLWLRGPTAEARENLEREAEARGVDSGRLIFAAHVASMEEHLARHALADLYLDTLPYNAHSTACDALWAGVPVLTCVGSGFASRVAASALTTVGLPELITHDLAEYERVALELARQPQRLVEYRERLAQQRLQTPLFDTQRYSRHLEEAYRGMHQRAVNGKAPAGFDVATRLIGTLATRAHALRTLGRFEEALESYDSAIALEPDSPDILADKIRLLEDLGRHDELALCLERLLRLSPWYDHAAGRLLQSRLEVCAWDDYSQRVAQLAVDLSEGRRVAHPFASLMACASPELQLRAAELHVGPATQQQVIAPDTRARRAARIARGENKVRVAYVSADFREHAASYLLAGVFERHDRRRFETIAISLLPPERSAMGDRVAAAFDRFIDVSQQDDEQVVELMRELEVDIAIDLMGHTTRARPRLFALRGAPVQVNYLGYPGTSGAPYLDYIVADEFVIPPGAARYYSEKVVYLPECFQANDDRCPIGARPRREAVGLPAQGPVLCSFNSSFKLNPPLFAIWMRLLREIPSSVLWLLSDRDSTATNLRREAESHGVDPWRLVFAGKVPYASHLGRLGLADLALDTSPYNGGASTSDALRVGVPVLTCSGEAFAARMAGSLLRCAGLPELVASSLEEYAQRGVELLSHPQALASLRARLAENLPVTSLFDSARYCRQLEAAYVGMYERVMQGEPAASFAVTTQD